MRFTERNTPIGYWLRYPRVPICRNFAREGGAVSARHTQGLRSPFPLQQSKVRKCARRPGRTFAEQSAEVWPGGTFARRSGKVHPAAGLLHGKAQKCARRQPRNFRTAKRESVPGPGFFRPVFFARFFAAVGPGKKASYKREAAYRKRRKNYVASYLDFRPPRSDLCAAGPENGLGPGRAGKAAAG